MMLVEVVVLFSVVFCVVPYDPVDAIIGTL